MISINNYVYTDRGILSVQDLLDIQTAGGQLPKLMRYRTNITAGETYSYHFDTFDTIVEVEDQEIYELKFVDVMSMRNITLNATKTSSIYQYNVIQTEMDGIINKNFQVTKFLISNYQKTKLLPRWEMISNLTNYANKSPNIGLGDTIIKYVSKVFIGNSKAYVFHKVGDPIETFCSLTRSTHFNFVLIK